jgi:hypothetical protein
MLSRCPSNLKNGRFPTIRPLDRVAAFVLARQRFS